MMRNGAFLMTIIFSLGLSFGHVPRAVGQARGGHRTVVVQSGPLQLRAWLWRPKGQGPFPAVLFNHGSGHGVRAPSGDRDEDTMEWQAAQVAPVFVRHG